MKKLKLPIKICFLFFLPLSLGLTHMAVNNAQGVEAFYARPIYPVIGQLLSRLTGLAPFSVAEFFLVFFILYLCYSLGHIFLTIIRRKAGSIQLLGHWVLNLMIGLSLVYFSFVVIWGLNYHRLPFGTIAQLDTRPASIEELGQLCEDLIERANHIRLEVAEDENGVMTIPGGPRDVFSRAHLGYDIASERYPVLGGTMGKPKGVFFSEAMSYTGIAGIYFPFTGEANVNITTPNALLPATTTHEMAHQRGFAREDEANFIAYLSSSFHPDPDFQYSGLLLALIHSMNQLYRYDPEAYQALSAQYGEGIRRDLQAIRDYNARYEGPIERTHTKINNAYLKSNHQEDGVHSYGRMVDLLIADYRQRMLQP